MRTASHPHAFRRPRRLGILPQRDVRPHGRDRGGNLLHEASRGERCGREGARSQLRQGNGGCRVLIRIPDQGTKESDYTMYVKQADGWKSAETKTVTKGKAFTCKKTIKTFLPSFSEAGTPQRHLPPSSAMHRKKVSYDEISRAERPDDRRVRLRRGLADSTDDGRALLRIHHLPEVILRLPSIPYGR